MMRFFLSRERSIALHALGTALNAGASPSEALLWLGSGQSGGRMARAGRDAHDRVQRGEPLSQALTEGTPALVERDDIYLLRAAEKSGSIPEVLRSIAENYELSAREVTAVLNRAAYPVLLFHLVAFVSGLLAMVNGKSTVVGILKILIPGYAVAALLVWLYHKSSSRRDVAAFLLRVPLVGKVVNRTSLLAYLRTLRLGYDAGVPLPRAAAAAAEVVKNRVIGDRLAEATRIAERGEPLTPALAQLGLLRPEIASSLCIGELSGALSTALAKAEEMYAEEAQRVRTRLVVVLSGALYYGVAGLVVLRVISFYAIYYKGLP
jgi:type IV pilus assembly protein PilC